MVNVDNNITDARIVAGVGGSGGDVCDVSAAAASTSALPAVATPLA